MGHDSVLRGQDRHQIFRECRHVLRCHVRSRKRLCHSVHQLRHRVKNGSFTLFIIGKLLNHLIGQGKPDLLHRHQCTHIRLGMRRNGTRHIRQALRVHRKLFLHHGIDHLEIAFVLGKTR